MTGPAVTSDASEPASWAVVRLARTAMAEREYHGWTGAMEPRAYSVTGLDRYLQCPFKYFAASVLRLEEEPERRPGLTPLERGRFEHEVFQLFFERWDASGRGVITAWPPGDPLPGVPVGVGGHQRAVVVHRPGWLTPVHRWVVAGTG